VNDDVGPATKITVLLHEYDTLRNQILQSYGRQFQLLSVFSAIIAGLVALAASRYSGLLILLIVGSLILYGVLFVVMEIEVGRVAARLKAIEAQVNALAGEPLLRWETDFGWGGIPRLLRLKGLRSH
jgi:hypothetical protein